MGAVQSALDRMGVDDRVEVVGEFEPRGHSGASLLGGFVGSDIGGAVGGGLGDAIGLGAGVVVGGRARDSATNLPRDMLVGASPTAVYGFGLSHKLGSKREAEELVFHFRRETLETIVHARVNVRVLELIDTETGAKIELEGYRMPIRHAHDLIKYVAGHHATDTADATAAEAGEELAADDR